MREILTEFATAVKTNDIYLFCFAESKMWLFRLQDDADFRALGSFRTLRMRDHPTKLRWAPTAIQRYSLMAFEGSLFGT